MPIALIIIVALMLGVIFVNGWTDAPNAIATVVSTRVLSPSNAVKVAVVFNFFGVFAMTYISAKVANTLSNIVDLSSYNSSDALTVFAAAMFAIVVWAVGAWSFGIPTSESHALIAGVTGAALALGGLKSVSKKAWLLVIVGLFISSILGFIIGFIISKITEITARNAKRSSANKFFAGGQVFGAISMSFMHGAQDGQKFMGTFLLGLTLYKTDLVNLDAAGEFIIPFWLIILCSAVMGLGTSVGGYKIIKAVGMDMVKLEKYQGFAADIAASICLLIASLTGVPVSTTHTKTTAIMGVGASRNIRSVNWGVVKEMVLAWVLTFPGCGLIAFIMARIGMYIF